MASNTDLQFNITVGGIQGLVTSMGDANKAIKQLTQNYILAANAGQDLTQVTKELQQAFQVRGNIAGITQMNAGLQQTSSVSANAGMALLNLNYVIRDSPYFFNNFAMGVLAVGNNLNPLIDSFNRLRKDAVEKNISTFALLKQAMVGGAGISIAFSVIVTAIQSYVFATSRAGDKTRSLADSMKELWSEAYKTTKQWDEFILSLDKLSRTDIEESIRGVNTTLSEGKPVFSEIIQLVLNLGAGLGIVAERMAEIVKQKGALQDALGTKKEGSVGGGIIEQQQALVESYEILLKSAKTDEERLGWLKLYKEAQEKLNELMGKEKKGRENITGEIHKQAKAMKDLMNVARGGTFISGDIRNLRGRGEQPSVDRPIASIFEGASGKRMKDSMKEFNMALETGKLFANELGNALNQAFVNGKLALDEFIKSLLSAIAQMLILRAITAFLTGGTSLAATASPIAPSVMPKGLGKIGIDINGKIEAKQDKFVIDFKKAEYKLRKLQT